MAKPNRQPDAVADFEDIRVVLVRCVRKTAPRHLWGDVDDIVQKAMVRLMTKAKKEETEEFATSYLWKVAHNAVIDELRSRSRRREVPNENVDEPSAADDPERRVLDAEVGDAIVDCLRRLNEDRRLAVSLYLQGHSLAETAGMLAWPSKRTENFVYRGLGALRECLRSKGIAP